MEGYMLKALWAMITWNEYLKKTYSNILSQLKLLDVSILSTFNCERFFYVHNIVKNQTRKSFGNKALRTILRVVLEGLTYSFDHILVEAIKLWRNST